MSECLYIRNFVTRLRIGYQGSGILVKNKNYFYSFIQLIQS